MMTKLVNLSRKNKFFEIVIKASVWLMMACINIWNETTGFLRSHGLLGKQYSELLKLKNKYSGKRCFIICTGPSLTLEDLGLIKNEITFGMNSIIKVYNQTDFRPTFYGIQDHIVYGELEKNILNYYGEKENIFVSDRIKRHFKIDQNWNVFPLNLSYNAYCRWFSNTFFAKFSNDIHRVVYSGFSITYSLIEIAAYMGFNDIYLIGADCSFSKTGKNHFAEHGVLDTTIDTARDRNLAGYEEIKKQMDKYGFKVFNATRGGELDVFERVNLDSIISEEEA